MPIKNVKELRDDLLNKYESAKTEQDKKELGTYTATASAIIRSLKVELDYNKYKGDTKDIDFLNV